MGKAGGTADLSSFKYRCYENFLEVNNKFVYYESVTQYWCYYAWGRSGSQSGGSVGPEHFSTTHVKASRQRIYRDTYEKASKDFIICLSIVQSLRILRGIRCIIWWSLDCLFAERDKIMVIGCLQKEKDKTRDSDFGAFFFFFFKGPS